MSLLGVGLDLHCSYRIMPLVPCRAICLHNFISLR